MEICSRVKKIYSVISFFIICFLSLGGISYGAAPVIDARDNPQYSFSKIFGGSGWETAYDVSVGANGDMFITGVFEGTVNFAADFGETDSKTSNGSDDVFIVKVNSDGTYGWSRVFGSSVTDYSFGITADLTGNIYVTGDYGGTVNFAEDFGGADSKTPHSGGDAFVVKINSDGSYGWSKSFGIYSEPLDGLSTWDYGRVLKVDANNDLYVAGMSQRSVNFAADFGGTDQKTLGGGFDIFITKIYSNGGYGGTRVFSSSSDESVYDMVLGDDGSIYFTGIMTNTIDFAEDFGGSDVRTSRGVTDAFVSKINGDGTYGWTRLFGRGSNDYSYGIAIDSSYNAYITGHFGNTIDDTVNFAADFGGTDMKTAVGINDIYLTKVNSDGTYGWTKTFGTTGNEDGRSVFFDSDDNLYFSGYYSGTINFGTPFDSSDSKTTSGSNDTFITKMNSDESYGWTKLLGGTGFDRGYDMTMDPSGYIYSTGGVRATANLAADFGGTDNKTISGTEDAYLSKFFAGTIGDFSTLEDSVLEDQLIGFDADGDSLTFSLVSDVSFGVVSINSITGVFTYTPNANYNGADSFSYKVNDGGSDSDVATVNITVTPTNDAPVPTASDISTDMNVSGYTQVYPNDVDFGDTHSYAITSLPSFGEASIDTSGDVTYTPDINSSESDSFTVTVTDGGALSGIVLITVTVSGTDIGTVAGDTGLLGVGREDGGDDAGNLDTDTGNPVVDMEYLFTVLFKDSTGSAPQSAMLYLTNRTGPTPADYFTYDLICTGDYTVGGTCSYTTILPPSTVNDYYFEIVRSDGTTIRYPTSGNITGPEVEMLNNYAMLGLPRDINADPANSLSDLDCTVVYRWVSAGLSRNSGNKGAYELVDIASPLRAGEGYFMQKVSCGGSSLPELPLYSEIADESYEITLTAGWNIISSPYGGKVMLSDISVQKGADNDPVTWAEAVAIPNEWIINGIYYSDGLDWGATYTVKAAPDASLTPWLGYWVYLSQDDDTYKLIFTKP